MIYPKDFELKIGFSYLRNLIVDLCETDPGKELVNRMSFSSNPKLIRSLLGTTNEMKNLIEASVPLPQFSFFNVAGWLKSILSPGSFLSSEQLYKTALSFQTMKEINKFFNSETTSMPKCECLKNEFKNIPLFENIEREIFRCIENDGYVKDNASAQLFEIRKSIENISRSMHKIMRNVIDHAVSNGFVEKDVNPVIRDGRMVLPVPASNKKSLSGIVHDTSASGKTVFLEPAEVVEAGNHLRELQIDEEQEIINILISLTDLLRPEQEEIKRGCNLLANYDFIKAKSLFAIQTGGQLPALEVYPEIDWYHAVHPGLFLNLKAQNREVVALNLNLNNQKRILVISGPNAGGKSVTLKTVGTIQYMMQCGLLPTLYSNSHMGIFSNIFIDIGDEQSMENDLSTYSSHLSNMKFFINNANDTTLLLADEMGSGTEPQIGAALAQSILQELGEKKCFGIITTHYQNLKIFAENEDGFINGAMLYDRQHLRPTFQLSIGEPGSSFALEIARNIGMPATVLERAKEIVGSDYVDAERFTLDIQRDKRYWKNKRLEIKEKENRLNKLLENYENKAEELKNQRALIIKEAKQEAKEILLGANSRIERSIHEIRKSQADKERAKTIRKELDDYKKNLEKEDSILVNMPEILKPLKHKSKNNRVEQINKSERNKKEEIFEVGDFVKIDNGGVIGQILEINEGKAIVAFGNIRTNIDINKLLHAKKPPLTVNSKMVLSSQNSVESVSRERQLTFKNEIDVRGFRAEEALQAITYFIDDAIQFNARRVRILHGTGHGILRGLIREQLKSISSVKDFHDEDVRFGGAGITVVELD